MVSRFGQLHDTKPPKPPKTPKTKSINAHLHTSGVADCGRYACIDVCRSGLFCREELGTLNNVLVVLLVIEVRDSLGLLPAQLPLVS